MSIVITEFEKRNSTTYVDLLGVSLGLERLPGETSGEFRDRLLRAAANDRSHSFAGALSEISLQLGLFMKPLISLSGTAVDVTVNIDGVKLSNGTGELTIPLVQLDVDDVWQWRTLSEVAADITAAPLGVTASLLADDAPALQLCRQRNVLASIGQAISGQTTDLGKTGVLVGSEKFNWTVPSYVLASDGKLRFDQPVREGTAITYSYRVWPFSMVGSEVGLIGLLDPALDNVAVGTNGALAYQLRETIQTLMERDRSYWGK